MNRILLRLSDVKKSYPGYAGPIQALKGVTLDIYAGEIISLLGVNGAGKTTLSSIIATLIPASSGSIMVNGASMYDDLSFIDSLIMPLTLMVIGGYILPSLGLPLTYGGLIVVGSVVAMCFAATNFGGAGPLVADLQSDRSITYDITLPIPSWLVFAKTAVGFALYSIIMNSLTLLVGKLILMDRFDMSQLSIAKFLLMYISANLLFGFYCLTVAFFVKNSFEFGRFWVRVGNVLYFFSGLQFSWMALYKTLPTIACINLLNPLVYAVEGTRASVLGQEGNLNYWLCLAAVWGWTLVFSIIGYRFFKKRLDCV